MRQKALFFGLPLVGALAISAAGLAWLRHEERASPRCSIPREHDREPNRELPAAPRADEEEPEGSSGYAFHRPSGQPTSLRCDDAKRIVLQVRETMASPPTAVDPSSFADSAADWLDPHALWGVAPDAPKAELAAASKKLLREIERHDGACPSAEAEGAILVAWVGRLRREFDAARAQVTRGDASAARIAVSGSGDALAAAHELGTRTGQLEKALGESVRPFAEAARARFFPELDAHGWGEVALAAAVRAYVPIVDPHGAWAPYDEEASVYDVDLSARAPHPLWDRSEMTSVGVAITQGPAAPLQVDDLVLSIDGLATAGLPLEQLEQLGFVASDAREKVPAVVLRDGKLLTLAVGGPSGEIPRKAESALVTERISFGSGNVLVVAIRDVRDDLGEDLGRVLTDERRKAALAGVVLDLRGNGGGSTDGAMHALGLFMPGVPLFPMRRRDGTVEVERASEPPDDERWRGPVAALVDGATASAAEMMAGALTSYGRGPSIGLRTFGKGCAQEYLDDDPRTGVLRLTTLLYALPDGSPVQRVGLSPTLELALENPSAAKIADREASLAHAPPSWRGPDMRGPRPRGEPWAAHRGEVGPCKDTDLCSALKALSLGWPRRTPVAKKRPR